MIGLILLILFFMIVMIFIVILIARKIVDWIPGGGYLFDEYIWKPISNMLTNIYDAIAAPFVWLKNFFEGLLPPNMDPYASIITLMVIAGVVLLMLYLIIKMVRD